MSGKKCFKVFLTFGKNSSRLSMDSEKVVARYGGCVRVSKPPVLGSNLSILSALQEFDGVYLLRENRLHQSASP